jgi:DNA repair exonuclease SbcCD ATPase subunit
MERENELARLAERENEIVAQLHNAERNTPEFNALFEELTSVRESKRQLESEQNDVTDSSAMTSVYEALEGIPIAFLLTTDMYDLERKVEIIANSLSAVLEKNAEVERSLKREVSAQSEMINELREERDSANAELFDVRLKLNNAAEQLDEEKRIGKEKDAEIARLRESMIKSSDKIPVPTYEEYKEEHIKALESRPAIYDLQWTDERKKTHYTAKLAATGERMEPFSRLTLGLYRVLTDAEEVQRFRQEAEERAAREALERAAESAEAPPIAEDTFQSEEDAGVPEHTVDGEMDDAPVTRAEFKALAKQVEDLAFATGFPHVMRKDVA